MPQVKRRALLKGVTLTSLASLATGVAPGVRAQANKTARVLKRDPSGLLDLPEGFSVRVIEKMGETMDDGFHVPGRPDAMACFNAADGSLVLMRNHENVRTQEAFGPQHDGKPLPPEAYDTECYGGVSRVVLDAKTKQRKSSNLVLAGTLNNCAGGVSPWGWLTCEEYVSEINHGFVFLCDPSAASVQPPKVIKAYGRFQHEAASVDPKTHIAYLTEDQGDSAFYRFVPRDPSKPFEGMLQALAIEGLPRFDTGDAMPADALNVQWVDIDDPVPSQDTVRHQAHDKGAAFVRRGEGLWLTDDSAYFTATIGGRAQQGQVLRLNFRSEPNTLELVAESPSGDVLEMPDNLTFAPSGHLYVCEDGSFDNYIRRITPDGRVVTFARNALSDSEFAGVCFSPDGDTMFVNLQEDHLTLAITGPFEQDAASDGDEGMRTRGVEIERPWATPAIGVAGLSALALAAVLYRRRKKS